MMKRWLLLLMTLLCGACQSQAASPTVAVTVQVVTLAAPTPTPDCQPAAGVSLEVHRPGYGAIELQARGLVPGEKPSVFGSAQNSTEGRRFEEGPGTQGADAQGVFSDRLTGLQTLTGDISTTWDVRLVHARGVACIEVTVP